MSGPIPHPFSMPMYKDFVPNSIRPWIYVIFACFFQFSNCIYPGAMENIMGERAYMREDVTMCLYATLGGMAIYFPMLFRMKFRFPNKNLLITSAVLIGVCNMLVLYVNSLPLVWAMCFIVGICKIQGTFECMSSIQLWITPKRDFSIFFPVLHIIILGNIKLSDYVAANIAYYYNWCYMHYLVAFLMIVLVLLVYLLTNDKLFSPKLPLNNVDWLGGFIWCILGLQIAYLFNYGEFYDWFKSPVIRLLSGTSLVTLFFCVQRMMHINNPYLEPTMWRYRYVIPIFVLIGCIEVLMASENVLEEIFYEEGMHYTILTIKDLNVYVIGGIVVGALFALFWVKVLHLNYYKLMAIGVGGLAVYLACFYFMIGTKPNYELFWLPVFMRGFASCIIGATLLTCLEELSTFRHYFQTLAVFNIVHMYLGGSMGGALYSFGFRYFMTDNISRYSGYADAVAMTKGNVNFPDFIEHFMENMALISLKQLYGIALICCLILFVLFLVWDRPVVRKSIRKMPLWRTLVKAFVVYAADQPPFNPFASLGPPPGKGAKQDKKENLS